MTPVRSIPGMFAFTLLAGCLSGETYALPGTGPFVLTTAANFTLQDRDLLKGVTLGYRPWSTPDSSQGDIIEYTVLRDGSLYTDARIGGIPPAGGTEGGCYRPATGCWSARAAFHARGADDARSRYWQQRRVFTGNNDQVDFTWEQLNSAQQHVLDGTTASMPVTHRGPWDSTILNYLRGERLHERRHAGIPGSNGALRDRSGIMGAITASPVYIGPPGEQLGNLAGFDHFAATHKHRPGRIAAGTASGQLHVFDATDGSEVYAYLPSMLLNRLGRVARAGGTSGAQAPIGGAMTVASAEVGRMQWRTLLAGGGGNGFAGLYALDVTAPGFTPNILLFEKYGGLWGHVYGQPRIGRLVKRGGESSWYVFSGNGHLQAPGHPAALMLIDLETQEETAVELPGISGGLSAVVLLSTDNDDGAEFAFAGDMDGNLWMFRLDAETPDSTRATRIYHADRQRAILHAPVVARHPVAPGYLLYFVTTHPPGSAGSDSLHAIWIDPQAHDLETDNPVTDRQLLRRMLREEVAGLYGVVRVVSDDEPLMYQCPPGTRQCPQRHMGWSLDLPGCGERINGALRLRAGRVWLTTSTTDRGCHGVTDAPGNWLLSLDYLQGHDAGQAVFDIDYDGIIDRQDAIASPGNEFPVGIRLDNGRLSAPVIVRVEKDSDAMIINRHYPLAVVNAPDGTEKTPPLLQTRTAVKTSSGKLRVPAGPGGVPTPVSLQTPGPRARAGRYSWIDIVASPAGM